MNGAALTRWAAQAFAAEPYPDDRFPPSPYYRFLRVLAAKLKPELSVELGVSGGGGTLYLALGWPGGQVVGVDIEEYGPDHPLRARIDHVRAMPNVTLLTGCDSIAAVGEVGRLFPGLKVGILFIDTVHTRERTLAEYRAWQPLLAERSAVCLDDLDRPGMKDAWGSLPDPKTLLPALHVERILGKRVRVGLFGVAWRDGPH